MGQEGWKGTGPTAADLCGGGCPCSPCSHSWLWNQHPGLVPALVPANTLGKASTLLGSHHPPHTSSFSQKKRARPLWKPPQQQVDGLMDKPSWGPSKRMCLSWGPNALLTALGSNSVSVGRKEGGFRVFVKCLCCFCER